MSSSTDTLSFPKSPRPLALSELVCGAGAPLDPVAADKEVDLAPVCKKESHSKNS